MTLPADVVQSQQENSIANDKTGALQSDRDRRLWLSVRRAAFIVIQAIEERYDMLQTKAGR